LVNQYKDSGLGCEEARKQALLEPLTGCTERRKKELHAQIDRIRCADEASTSGGASGMWCAVFGNPVTFPPVPSAGGSGLEQWMMAEQHKAKDTSVHENVVVRHPANHYFLSNIERAAIVAVVSAWETNFTVFVLLHESNATIRCLLYIIGPSDQPHNPLQSRRRNDFVHWVNENVIANVLEYWQQRAESAKTECGGLLCSRVPLHRAIP
jgi:hypothetical protein